VLILFAVATNYLFSKDQLQALILIMPISYRLCQICCKIQAIWQPYFDDSLAFVCYPLRRGSASLSWCNCKFIMLL